MSGRAAAALALLGLSSLGCTSEDALPAAPEGFRAIARTDAALMSVHGTNTDDVWLVGADDGAGPLVLHFDGRAWERRDTGVSGDLWWVHALVDGPVFLSGSEGLVLRYESGIFEPLPTPETEEHTVFGAWAAAPNDVYFVGSVAGANGFLWHYDGSTISEIALPAGLPEDGDGNPPGLLKIWGTSAGDVWAVGNNGVVLRGSATRAFELVRTALGTMLFTVHANAGRLVMVGGSSSGVILEALGGELVDETPPSAPLLQGVNVSNTGEVWACGYAGTLYADTGAGFEPIDSGIDLGAAESLHSVWIDPKGGVWSAGGDVLTPALARGIAIHRGEPVPAAEF